MIRQLFVMTAILMNVCSANHEQSFVFPAQIGLQAEINNVRQSSYPYISGDTFRAIADFVIDEKKVPFYPSKVKEGDVIFLKVDGIEFFFSKVHQHIPCRYILITHNGALSAPGKYAHFLDDPKLIAWFGHNRDISNHPKFFTLPLGLANNYWSHGNTKIIEQSLESASGDRPYLFYVNIANTHSDRMAAERAFKGKAFCTHAQRKPFQNYIQDLARSKFVLSPRGVGIDCHRAWESLLMGAIPVMKHSTIDPVFEGLPIVLVNDWSEVTEQFLLEKWEAMQQQVFYPERMFAEYWIKKILEIKRATKEQYIQ